MMAERGLSMARTTVMRRVHHYAPESVRRYADHIPDVRWHVFEQSSHMPHVEEKDACLAAVAAFLDAA
jgi:L-proline amide hydrolase